MNISSTNIKATFLLLIVAIPLFLSIGFLLTQLTIQFQMEYELETAARQKFTLGTNQVHWIKKNKEILINGKFFDLKSFTVNKDSIIVEGIFDEEEDSLNEKYSDLIDHKKQKYPFCNSLSLTFLFIFNATLPPSSPSLELNLLSKCSKRWHQPSNNIISQFLRVNIPPPIG